MCNQQANNSTGNHADEHEGGHVVAGLLQQPHGQNCSKENVNKGDVAPGSLVKIKGNFMPTAKDSTMNTMPRTASFQPEKLNFFWIRPKMTANTMNMMETMPAEPLVKAASTCAPSASKALKVPATMSAKQQ